MRFAAAFFLIVSAVLTAAQSTVTLNTPQGVAECFNTLLTWSGGTGPYQIQILPGGQPSAAPLEDLGILTGTSYTWLCKQAAGTQIFLRLKDTSSGQLSETATVTVLPGNPALCSTGSSSGAPAPSGATTPAVSSPATAPATSNPAVTTAPGTTPTTTAAGNTSTSKPQSSNNSRTSSGAATSPTTTAGAGQLKVPVALAVTVALAMAVFV